MMKCRKQRTYHLLSTRQNLRSNASFEMTYVRDTPLALSFYTGSDHPELPRMIRANSDFQHWASLDDSVLHRMIWTQIDLTGLDDRSDRSGSKLFTCTFRSEKWCYGLLFEELSHLRDQNGYIKVIVNTASTISIIEYYLCAWPNLWVSLPCS